MPLVVLIIIFFLLYNFWMPASIFKWLSISALAVYLGVGFYYQKKLRNLLDDFSDNNENKEIE